MATTIKVIVPEAYALDSKGHQLDKLVIKHARTQADMEPQLSAFADKWNASVCLCGREKDNASTLCEYCK